MFAQAVVQLRVVPRVEARKRREDRWERDVLALGELLTADLPDRAKTARIEQWFLQLMNSLQPADAKVAEHAETLRGLVEKADEAVESYEAVAKTRVRWLVQRIVSLAPRSDELQKFYFIYVKFSMASSICTGYNRPRDDYDEDTFEIEWKAERRARGDLTLAVERLASSMPPRRASRLRERWRWIVRWRGRKKAEREAWKEVAELQDKAT